MAESTSAVAAASAVLFDLDGLLVDSEPLWQEAIEAVVAAHGGTYSKALALQHRGCRLPDVVRILMAGCAMSTALAPEQFGDALVENLLGRFDRLRPMTGADEALRWVRDVSDRVALATSSRGPIADAALAVMGWTDAFDVIVTGDEVQAGKPEPDIFRLAAQRLEVEPAAFASCVVLEDSVNGVRAALAAGMKCIAVPHAAEREAVAALRPHYLLNSLAELA